MVLMNVLDGITRTLTATKIPIKKYKLITAITSNSGLLTAITSTNIY